jgi:actin-related protein
MGQFKRSSRCEPTNETLGSLLVNDFKKAISAESVTGLNVILSMDPRLAIMQGANVLMNLSSNSKHYVSSQDYFESGNERDNLIN